MLATPLKALVLAGGRSARMGRDKAAIMIGGQNLLARTVALAAQYADDVLVGVREPVLDDTRAAFQTLPDAGVGAGPMDSILAALQHDPNADWLVLACDMPLLDAPTLSALVRAADTHRSASAVAIADSSGTLPEPLCAIWRAPMRAAIIAAFEQDRRCARKCLINVDAQLVPQVSAAALLNMNTSDDVQAAKRHGANVA